ncbi:MAG: hypothetical protein WCF79_02865 [Rhodomicrobium sp.]
MTKLSDYISGGKRIVEGHTFDPEHMEVLATFCYEAVGNYDWDRDECATTPRKGWIVRNPHGGALYEYEERVLDEKTGGDPGITVEAISIEDAVSHCYEFNAKILVEFFVPPPAAKTGNDTEALCVRMPRALKAKLSEAASMEHISLNTIIVQSLEQRFAA